MQNVKDDLNNLLEESAHRLLDAVSIMNDGPDESDIAMAYGRLNDAIELARKHRYLYEETFGESAYWERRTQLTK